MTNPALTVQIAFQANPYATPTWTDVTQWVKAADTNRGRQYELDKTEAGVRRELHRTVGVKPWGTSLAKGASSSDERLE